MPERSVRRALLSVAVAAVLAATVAGGAGSSSDAESGREVFSANCAMCHGSDASGMMGMHPSLRGAVARLTREGVEVTIRNGRATTPPMPAFAGRLTDREIEQVIAYLDTLPDGPRNFGPDSEGGMMGGMMEGMSGWMWLVPLLVVVLALVAVLVLTRARGSRPGADAPPSPREVLDRRYAEGQLTREEYLQQRHDIES